MKLPVIRKMSDYTLTELNSTVNMLETMSETRGVSEEELDVIGEILSNLYGALEVRESIISGSSRTDALNNFMKKVTSIGSK